MHFVLSDDKFRVEVTSLPVLKNSKLVCGLPGSGFVAKLAVDYLIDKLQAEKFADIYSESFPPQVTIQKDGTIDLMKCTMYYSKVDGHDLVLLTGDAQPGNPDAEYGLAHKVLEICNKIGVNYIITLAAYITGTFSKEQKVFGTGTSKEIVKCLSKYQIKTMDRGSITGMNGVVIGVAKKLNLSGVCLLGETSGYVIDAIASKELLDVLTNMLGIKLDMAEMIKRAEDTAKIIKTIEEQASRGTMGQAPQMPKSITEEKNLGYIN